MGGRPSSRGRCGRCCLRRAGRRAGCVSGEKPAGLAHCGCGVGDRGDFVGRRRSARAVKGRALVKRTRISALLGVAALLAAGVLAALAIAPSAAAYSIDQLPGLGYSTSKSDLGNGCHSWKAGYGNVLPPQQTDLGSDCDSGFQGRVDALVAATCPCAQTTSSAATTDAAATTVPATTTETQTTTQAVTETSQTTTTSPAATTVEASDPAVADLTARVSTLEQEVVALTARLDALVQGQTVTLSARTWRVATAKNGLATLVATKKKPGEKAKPKRRLPSSALVPLLKAKQKRG